MSNVKTLSQMATEYNAIVAQLGDAAEGRKAIKKFGSRDVAERRLAKVEELLSKVEKAKAPSNNRRTINIAPVEGAEIKACRQGSKQATLIDALKDGATLEQLHNLLGWSDAAIKSAFSNDVRGKGYGVRTEQTAGKNDTYHLVVPKGATIPAHK